MSYKTWWESLPYETRTDLRICGAESASWDASRVEAAQEIKAIMDNPGGDGNLPVALGRWLEQNLPGYRFGWSDPEVSHEQDI